MKKATIYQILNIVNNKCYIGSSICYTKRKVNHLYFLRRSKHHSLKLQRAWNKYGEENFRFVVLEKFEYSTKEEVLQKEQLYLDNLKPYYNIALFANSCLGVTHGEPKMIDIVTGETFTSMGAIAKSRNLSETTVRNRIMGYMLNNINIVFIDPKLRIEAENRWKNKKRIKYKIVEVLDLDGINILYEFPSINKASEYLKISGKTIKRHCDGKKDFKKKIDFIIRYKY